MKTPCIPTLMLLLVALQVSCGESPAQVLERVQQAVDREITYRVTFTGHNLILPNWGGVDSGTLSVSAVTPLFVVGYVDRTGDGRYEIIFIDNATFFRRETCSYMTRIPGGGSAMLKPFLWSATGALVQAKAPKFVPSSSDKLIAVRAEVQYLGEITLEILRDTYLPVSLSKERDLVSGIESQWMFDEWGRDHSRPSLAYNPAERGPGGNPC